jgi:hypothetical protein
MARLLVWAVLLNSVARIQFSWQMDLSCRILTRLLCAQDTALPLHCFQKKSLQLVWTLRNMMQRRLAAISGGTVDCIKVFFLAGTAILWLSSVLILLCLDSEERI